MKTKVFVSLVVGVVGSVGLAACGRDDETEKLPRSDDDRPVIDLREPTPTSAFGAETEVASFEPKQVVKVLLPMIEFEILADGVTLYAPADDRDLTTPRTEPNPNPINIIEFGVLTTDDVAEVFSQIDDVIEIFGVDESAEQTLAEIRDTLETTTGREYEDDFTQSNIFTSGLRATDEYEVTVRIRRWADERMRLSISVGFDNGVYDGTVGQWPPAG